MKNVSQATNLKDVNPPQLIYINYKYTGFFDVCCIKFARLSNWQAFKNYPTLINVFPADPTRTKGGSFQVIALRL